MSEFEALQIDRGDRDAFGYFVDYLMQNRNFREQLTVRPAIILSAPRDRNITYTREFPLPPGLYQVRVAAYESGGKRVGTANSWIEVPELTETR